VADSNAELEAQRSALAARLKQIHEEVQSLRTRLSEEELGMMFRAAVTSPVLAQCEETTAARQRRERLEITLSEEKLGLAVQSIQGTPSRGQATLTGV